jgi:hypothetical protein
MRDQDSFDVAFWVGVGLGLLVAWKCGREGRDPAAPAASDAELLEAMWAAAPREGGRDASVPAEAVELFECAGCGGLLEAQAWRFCGWCGSPLGWPTRP